MDLVLHDDAEALEGLWRFAQVKSSIINENEFTRVCSSMYVQDSL